MSAASVSHADLLERRSAFNRVVKGKGINTYDIYKQGMENGETHETSISMVQHHTAAKSLELLLSRKKKQYLGIGFSEIVLLYVTIRKNRRIIEIAVQTMQQHLLNHSRNYLLKWQHFNRKYKKRINNGGNILKWFMERKSALLVKESYEILAYFSIVVLRILEKIERQYALPHRSLLSQILSINNIRVGNSAAKPGSTRAIHMVEEITVVDAPTKFNRQMTIKKNGYRYLSLLLRRSYLKRQDSLFEWYQKHTLDMRYAMHMNIILNNLFKKVA